MRTAKRPGILASRAPLAVALRPCTCNVLRCMTIDSFGCRPLATEKRCSLTADCIGCRRLRASDSADGVHRTEVRGYAVCEHLRSARIRSEEHTSEPQSLMRIPYAVFCLKKKKKQHNESTPPYLIH